MALQARTGCSECDRDELFGIQDNIGTSFMDSVETTFSTEAKVTIRFVGGTGDDQLTVIAGLAVVGVGAVAVVPDEEVVVHAAVHRCRCRPRPRWCHCPQAR